MKTKKTFEATPAVPGTAAFSKFMVVLQCIADSKSKISVAVLSKLTGFPRPTVHRIVSALIAEDLVRESIVDDTLLLGPRLIGLASQSLQNSDIRAVATDAVARLRDQTRETVHLAVPSGTEMVYVDKLESPQAVRMVSRIGTRVPMHASSVGKAFLAALSDERLEVLLPTLPLKAYTKKTISDRTALRRAIADMRRTGYATDNEEVEPQIVCYGAAIRDAAGVPVAAISVSIPVYRLNSNPTKTYINPLLRAVSAVSDLLTSSD